MPFFARTALSLLCSCLLLVIAAGCGDSPAKPSGLPSTGAVIAGMVTSASAAASASTASAGGSRVIRLADSPFVGLTVRIVGANRSAVVGSDGTFQISDVPRGTVQLQFSGDSINATITISNVAPDQFIQIQVQVNGPSAVLLDETRTGKVSLCHAEGNGTYHLIEVSESAEPAHRDHGDAEVGEAVPGQTFKIFDTNCLAIGPSIDIEKFTNGEDADNPPGPEILVGDPVTWTYVVKNTGTVQLTGIVVTDNPPATINCGGQTTLAANNSMTCTATAIGGAVLGQYSNVATATGTFTFSGITNTVSDTDASHYRGVLPVQEEEGPKVSLCHRTGAGFFVLISVGIAAEPAHIAHGDGKPGEAVPSQAGRFFTSTCGIR